MKRKYEGVYILNLQTKEEGIESIVSGISKELESNGAKLEQIDRIGRKAFTYPNHAKQTHGYYVQFHFQADTKVVKEVRSKLRLNEEIMLQHYRRS